MPGVNSKNNKIVIRGRFSDLRYDILEKFNENDIVELQAEDKFIELAIKLSEDLVQNNQAFYESFRSGLNINQQREQFPMVSIKLRYNPPPPPPPKQAYQQEERVKYRERDSNRNEDNYKGRYQERVERSYKNEQYKRDRGNRN